MTDFRLPILGADMTSGTVVEYLVRPGEPVTRGQIVAVIDTEKAAIEVESPVDGVWDCVVVPVGREVPVGTVLATIATEAAPSRPASKPEPPADNGQRPVRAPRSIPPSPQRFAEPPVASPIVRHLAHTRGIDLRQVTPTGPRGVVTREDVQRAAAPSHVRASPYARRRAAELGVDARAVTGTGPGGAVTAADVSAFASAQPAREKAGVPAATTAKEPPTDTRSTAAARRQAAVAKLMARSKREIPHFYLATTVDCGPLLEEVRRRNEGRPMGERLLPAAGLLRAVVKAAAEVPSLNGHWIDGSARLAGDVDLGVAISLRDGSLIAPAMLGCQRDSMDELMKRLKGLVGRARQGKLTGEDAREPSITVTNLGDQGVETGYPIIYPPQLARVGLGRISTRPWAIADTLAVRPVISVTVAVDHRAVNGHQAGLFLAAIARALQAPAEL